LRSRTTSTLRVDPASDPQAAAVVAGARATARAGGRRGARVTPDAAAPKPRIVLKAQGAEGCFARDWAFHRIVKSFIITTVHG
jgi:hypothetical protein